MDDRAGLAARSLSWLSVAATLAALVLVPRADDHASGYFSASPRPATLDVTVPLVLVAAVGAGLLLDRRYRPGALPLGVAALAWSAPTWTAWTDGSASVRSAGYVGAALLLPLLVHAAVVAAGWREWAIRWGLGVAYAAAVVVTLERALFYDPFLDPHAWAGWEVNTLLVAAHPDLAATVELGWRWAWAAAGLVLVALATVSWWRGSPARRRSSGPAFLASVLLGVLAVVTAMARERHPDIETTNSRPLVVSGALVTILVGLVWAAGPVREAVVRLSLGRLVAGIGSTQEAGTVARVLASATGDPELWLLYRLPDGGGYVDDTGRTVRPPPGATTTSVRRDGREVALALHDPGVHPDRVRDACGTAVLLALDNERLRAAALAQLRDLRASRARIVAAGDAERRHLERNLHDGAQQRLLALTFDLRRAVAATDGHARDLAVEAEREAQRALAELRDLAHGIHPAVLDEAGLSAALWSLADSAPLPLVVESTPARRLSAEAEQTAYVVVRDALEAASRRGAAELGVEVVADGDVVHVTVRGAGPGPFVAIEDRVEGVGGRLTVTPDLLEAVIPCASSSART